MWLLLHQVLHVLCFHKLLNVVHCGRIIINAACWCKVKTGQQRHHITSHVNTNTGTLWHSHTNRHKVLQTCKQFRYRPQQSREHGYVNRPTRTIKWPLVIIKGFLLNVFNLCFILFWSAFHVADLMLKSNVDKCVRTAVKTAININATLTRQYPAGHHWSACNKTQSKN